MTSKNHWFPRKWHTGDIYALTFLLLGLSIVLFIVATDEQYLTWTLWFALPMIMFCLAYIFLVSALPIWLGPRSGSDSEEERPPEKDHE